MALITSSSVWYLRWKVGITEIHQSECYFFLINHYCLFSTLCTEVPSHPESFAEYFIELHSSFNGIYK